MILNCTKNIFALLLSLVVVGSLAAQGLSYPVTVWDFGDIHEQDGEVCYRFTAVNNEHNPIVIDRTYTSCGCTTADYPRKPIYPGDTVSITVCFDPSGRPGAFHKQINLAINGTFRDVLTITGNVIPKPHGIEDDFPFYIGGGLRFDRNTFGFGHVWQNGTKSMVIRYVNTSERQVSLKFNTESKSGLLHVTAPRIIAPHAEGDITLTYDLTRSGGNYGILTDKLLVDVNGRVSDMGVYASAIGVDDFSLVDPDTAPKLSLSPQFKDLERVQQSVTPVTYTVTATNDGESPLVVRWVDDSRPGMKVRLRAGTRIAPHKSITFEVELDTSKYYTAEVFDAVTIVVNDPSRPSREIKASAKLKF